MPITSIRLKDELKQSLDDLARQTDRSKNWLINEAVASYIAQHKLEQQRWLETLPALESVRAGRTVSGEPVKQWLQSWGTDQETAAPVIKPPKAD